MGSTGRAPPCDARDVLSNRVVGWIACAASLFSQSACSPGCEEACVGGSFVRFEPPITKPGQYRLHVTTSDGLDAECSLIVPATSQFLDCGVWVSARDPAKINGFEAGDTPSRIDVLLEKDDTVLADAALAPSYEIVESCGMPCRTAETPLSVATE